MICFISLRESNKYICQGLLGHPQQQEKTVMTRRERESGIELIQSTFRVLVLQEGGISIHLGDSINSQ